MEGETVERDAAEAFVEKWMPKLGRRQAKEWGADFLAAAEVAFNEGEAEAVARLSADRERALTALEEEIRFFRGEVAHFGTAEPSEWNEAKTGAFETVVKRLEAVIADLRGEGR